MIPRTIVIAALALIGCAHAAALDGHAERATASRYLIRSIRKRRDRFAENLGTTTPSRNGYDRTHIGNDR